MSYQPLQSKLMEISDATIGQPNLDLSSSFLDDDPSFGTKEVIKPSKITPATSRLRSILRKQSSHVEIDLKGQQARWRSELHDELDDHEDTDMGTNADPDPEWYKGEELERLRSIPRDWVIIPAHETKKAGTKVESSDRLSRTQTLLFSNADAAWLILPRMSERSGEELAVMEEELRRYQSSLWTKRLVGIGMLGVEMLLEFSGKTLVAAVEPRRHL